MSLISFSSAVIFITRLFSTSAFLYQTFKSKLHVNNTRSQQWFACSNNVHCTLSNTAVSVSSVDVKKEDCFWKKVPQNKGQLQPVVFDFWVKLHQFLQKQTSFLQQWFPTEVPRHSRAPCKILRGVGS